MKKSWYAVRDVRGFYRVYYGTTPIKHGNNFIAPVGGWGEYICFTVSQWRKLDSLRLKRGEYVHLNMTVFGCVG